MAELKTLTQGKLFRYEGSVKDGISIVYGKAGYASNVSSDTLQQLLKTWGRFFCSPISSNLSLKIEGI